MAVASVTKITAASSEGFDAAVREGLARASRTLRGITGLHIIEHKASVENGKIEEYGDDGGHVYPRKLTSTKRTWCHGEVRFAHRSNLGGIRRLEAKIASLRSQ